MREHCWDCAYICNAALLKCLKHFEYHQDARHSVHKLIDLPKQTKNIDRHGRRGFRGLGAGSENKLWQYTLLLGDIVPIQMSNAVLMSMSTCAGKACLGRYGQAARWQASTQDGSHQLIVGVICGVTVDCQCARHIS